MGLIADLLGILRPGVDNPPARSIADVEAALVRLAGERTVAGAALKAAHQARAEMLITDATKKDIAAVEAKADTAALLLERLELVEPRLLEELRALRGKARQDLWRDIFAKYPPALDDYAKKFRAVVEAHDTLIAVRQEALDARFGAEAAHVMTGVPIILSREALHLLDREAERVRDAISARPRPKPAAPKRAPDSSEPWPPKPQRMVEISNHRMNDPGLLRAKRNRDPLRITGPLSEGQSAVRLLKSQIDIGDAFGWAGDEIAIDEFKAKMLILNGAAEPIEIKVAAAGEKQPATKSAEASPAGQRAAEEPGAEDAA